MGTTPSAPYDGSDDALIGVINNSGAIYNGSITLSGTGNGGGLFAFDFDGICNFGTTGLLAYCASGHSTDPLDYAGPLNTFTGIDAGQTTGTVVFTGLGVGATTFFSLEGSPASINAGGGPTIGGTPEPATLALFGGGLVGLYTFERRRRKQA